MKTKNTIHEPTVCKRKMGMDLAYNGKNWSDAFRCPVCGAQKRYNLNFLGGHKVICDGSGKFTKV